MRVANLSSGGDPFLSMFCLKLFKERFYDEVDRFIINYNNHSEVPQEVVEEFLSRASKDPKVDIIYHPMGIGNGNPIKEGMLISPTNSSILLLEDDSFIFTPGIVDSWFRIIEEGKADIVGSPRYATGEVADAAKRKFNLDYSGIGDKGFGWWPSFFICKREDLLKTDLDFGSKRYPKGEYFKELDHGFSEDCYTDTFTWASIQLRYLGLKSFDIPQNHAHPYDLENQKNKSIMFMNGYPEYIHGGSLSSGWGGYLNKKTPPTETDMEKQDIETRVAFWKISLTETEGFYPFSENYRKGIEGLITTAQLDQGRIQQKINLYRSLMRI